MPIGVYIRKGKGPFSGKKHTHESKLRIGLAKKGELNPAKRSEVRKKLSENNIMKRNDEKGYRAKKKIADKNRVHMLCGGVEIAHRAITRISKPQRVMFEKIKEVFVDAVLELYVRTEHGKGYFLDIAVQSQMIDFEYDGENWHNEKTKDYDNKRDKDLTELGWKVVRIRGEKELKEFIASIPKWTNGSVSKADAQCFVGSNPATCIRRYRELDNPEDLKSSAQCFVGANPTVAIRGCMESDNQSALEADAQSLIRSTRVVLMKQT